MVLGFRSLHDLSSADPATHKSKLSTVILCAKGYLEQSRSFYLAEVALYMLREAMDSSIASVLKDFMEIEEKEGRRELVARLVKSQWPIDIINVAEDPEAHRLDNIIHGTERLTVEEADSSSSRSSPNPA
jgi:hypothetical protein